MIPSLALLTSTDHDPALLPLEQEEIRAPRSLPNDEQRLLEAALEGAPDGIVAGFKEDLAEVRLEGARPLL